jgi:hypothetical protein
MVKLAVLVLLVTCVVLSLWLGFRISARIKTHHRNIWESFDFPSERTFYVKANEETAHVEATIRELKFLFSHKRASLSDKHLDLLVTAGWVTLLTGVLALGVLVILIFTSN